MLKNVFKLYNKYKFNKTWKIVELAMKPVIVSYVTSLKKNVFAWVI